MQQMNTTFAALLKEAQFTKEVLGSGVTQIRRANYASKGIYFQAFTSISTGLERIGKLCLMIDHYLETRGSFPDFNFLKNKIGHKLILLYERSQEVVSQRAICLRYLQDLSDPVHHAIVKVLNDFAEGDRYSNINLLVGGSRAADPIAAWFSEVDLPLYKTRVTDRKKQKIARDAEVVARLLGSYTYVLHMAETGHEITDLEVGSRQTGIFEAVAPYRQFYMLQIIRYWVEVLLELEDRARALQRQDMPFFGELFAAFNNADSYFRTRKTWEDL